MEAAGFKRKERTFMCNWQRALTDIKESVRLASKSESEVIKFNVKDWLKWYKSINNHFRRTLGVRGVTLDWVYREQTEPKPRVKYPSIAAEIKATLILSGNHFEEDFASVYAIVATSTFDTTCHSVSSIQYQSYTPGYTTASLSETHKINHAPTKNNDAVTPQMRSYDYNCRLS
jgi:hypothetical protein